MKKPSFTPASLAIYQEANGGNAVAATADFHTDELRRLQSLYATLLSTYHAVQQAETDGARFLTLKSWTQHVKIDIGTCGIDLFGAIVEPLLKQLAAVERQIVAMTAELPELLEECAPTPETDAIMALCLPKAKPTGSHERCPLLPEAVRPKAVSA